MLQTSCTCFCAHNLNLTSQLFCHFKKVRWIKYKTYSSTIIIPTINLKPFSTFYNHPKIHCYFVYIINSVLLISGKDMSALDNKLQRKLKMFSFNFLPMFFYVYRNNKNKSYRRLAVYGILFTVSRLFILIVWKFLIIDISIWYEYICLIIWISIYEDVAIWPDGSILEPWTLFPLYSLSLKTAIEYNDTRNWKRTNL